jgi:hypothetical protein
MQKIGLNIERIQEMINTPMIPPPQWARSWQTEAEHVLHLAHNAKNDGDMEQLLKLDTEALRLVEKRESKLKL